MPQGAPELTETPAEAIGDPLLDEEASDDKGVCQGKLARVTLLCVTDHHDKEMLDWLRNPLRLA